jgi:beta-galactosidase
MAAWTRRTDPSRPVHYEGGLTFDLHAASPASDIVCPMYAPPDQIAAWADDGRDTRRPLILCEYNHAMGQAGGLADYWALFGRRGLQGGFVWEWCDHALRRIDADGVRVLAYGGDFGETANDGAFVCDGLVSADREPHPLLAELAALTQPVDVEWAGEGFVSVTNRRWFTSLDNVRATWVVEVDGRPVGRGVLDLPPIEPQQRRRITAPPLPSTTGETVAVTFTFRSRRATAWAARGSIEAVRQLVVPPDTAADTAVDPARAPASSRSRMRSTVDDEGDRLVIGSVGIVPPALSLWRPPTDNDDPPGEWHRRESAADRWRRWGLDRLEASAVEHRRDGTDHVSTTTYELAVGDVIHRQRRRVVAGAIEIVDEVTIPSAIDDLPRVGVRFELPGGFDALEWFGFGPGDSYPDRRAATTLGRWLQDVGEQAMPFVVPQEYGLHVDTRWFRIGDGQTTIEVAPGAPLAFSALPYRAEDLTSATHAHQLRPRSTTSVHVDGAHRGLGTAACGPDTAERWKVRGGTFRWAWQLRGRPGRQRTSHRSARRQSTIS